MVITLVNVGVSTYQGSVLKQPGWQDLLELTILISFRFAHYKTSLLNLNRTMQLLYAKPAYTAADAHPDNPFPPNLERVMFTLRPIELEGLKDLWGMVGDAAGAFGGLQRTNGPDARPSVEPPTEPPLRLDARPCRLHLPLPELHHAPDQIHRQRERPSRESHRALGRSVRAATPP